MKLKVLNLNESVVDHSLYYGGYMASKAGKAFDDNAEDIKRLLEIHKQIAGNDRGRKFDVEVINKSAIVLITAIWEAYVEDISAEALEHLVTHVPNSDALPEHLRKMISKELKDDKNELSIWKISDTKWKTLLLGRLDRLKEDRDFKWNSPKTANVEKLINDTIGLANISNCWKWEKMSVANAKLRLDKLIVLRGSIAHRNSPDTNVSKADATIFFDFIKNLVKKTEGKINAHLRSTTNVPLWD